MKCWTALAFLLIPFQLLAQTPPPATWAVVRIPSHGATCTVIYSEQGRTFLLGCAHAYQGKMRETPMKIDTQSANPGPAKTVPLKLIAVDYQADLSLVEMGEGPLPYVCKLAPSGQQTTRAISSGCDKMAWPPVWQPATIIGTSGTTTYTRENPIPGRSGGALIDADAGLLIGVVQGYETSGPRRGMYVSHQAIVTFLRKQGWTIPTVARQQELPQQQPFTRPFQMQQCPT